MQYLHKVKKFIWNLGASIFFVYVGVRAIFAVLEVSGIQVSNICNQIEVASIPSPSGKRVAKVSYSDCGEFSHVQTGVLLIDLESGKEYSGIFGIGTDPGDLKVSWGGEDLLVFSEFPIEKLLWFNQKQLSGVRFKIQ